MRKQLVLVEALVPGASDSDAHPEHPIYIPITPPPDSGLHPEHPIYFPCPPLGTWGGAGEPMPTPPIELPDGEAPPGTWGGAGEPMPTPPIFLPGPPSDAHPEHPIYFPVEIWGPNDPRPEVPIVLPPEVGDGLTDEQKEKLIAFLFGNLPPYSGPPQTQPV